MKILVIDNNPIHQQSARQTLGENHALTVVGFHDIALEYLSLGYVRWAFGRQGEYWDVVLSDLLIPAEENVQHGVEHVDTVMLDGCWLAITAALSGAKYVAVATDVSPRHRLSRVMLYAMSDTVFALHGARAWFTNFVPKVGIAGTEISCNSCSESGRLDGGQCCRCEGTGIDFTKKGKDWSAVLKRVMEAE